MNFKDLPGDYLENIHSILPDEEFKEFVKIYGETPYRGISFNNKKIRRETIEKLVKAWDLKPVSWCPQGWYYDGSIRPGLSPYHDAGVYYIQEPSAMLAIEMADIKQDELVLDLCASPGGKSAQAAQKCRILISNDALKDRARILSSNIERMGFDNCIVISSYPFCLNRVCNEWFDVVIVDAPCSGEGMIRKDESIALNWSKDYISLCSKRQLKILNEASLMLRPGGRLVFSTCTFEKAENEDNVAFFLLTHPDFYLLRESRIWPHKEKGEGHFCAVMKKDGDKVIAKKEISELTRLLLKGKIHVLRSGVIKGKQIHLRKGENLYIPSHAEAMNQEYYHDQGKKLNLLSEKKALAYLSGESFKLDSLDNALYENGRAKNNFVTVYFDKYPLGNARLSAGIFKNLYPKGLRRKNLKQI